MKEFPYLIFRKACYFCARKKECKKGVDFDDEGLCSEFVLDAKYVRFLSTEIFDEVVEVVERRKQEVVA